MQRLWRDGVQGLRNATPRGGSTGYTATGWRARSSMPCSSTRPSVEPSSGSTACSGCGISARDVASLVGHTGDRADRAVGVLAVAQQHLAARVQLGDRLGLGEEAAVVVLDRDRQHVAGEPPRQPRRLALDNAARRPEPELQRGVGAQHAGHQPGLGQHLEAVADAQHRPAAASACVAHRRHHRRESGQRAGAQVVAVAEAAGHDHGVDAPQIGVAVPQRDRLGAHQSRRRASRRGRRRRPGSRRRRPGSSRPPARPRTARSAGSRAPSRRSLRRSAAPAPRRRPRPRGRTPCPRGHPPPGSRARPASGGQPPPAGRGCRRGA